MKRKTECLGLSVCLCLQSNLSRKAMDVLFLGSHPREIFTLADSWTTPAARPGVRCHHRGLLSPLSSHLPGPVLSWIPVAALLAFFPFPTHTQWGSVSGPRVVCIEWIRHSFTFQNFAERLWSWKKRLQLPATTKELMIGHDNSAMEKWRGTWPGCHRAALGYALGPSP